MECFETAWLDKKFCFRRNRGLNGIEGVAEHRNNIIADIAGNNQTHHIITHRQIPVFGNFNPYIQDPRLFFCV